MNSKSAEVKMRFHSAQNLINVETSLYHAEPTITSYLEYLHKLIRSLSNLNPSRRKIGCMFSKPYLLK